MKSKIKYIFKTIITLNEKNHIACLKNIIFYRYFVMGDFTQRLLKTEKK